RFSRDWSSDVCSSDLSPMTDLWGLAVTIYVLLSAGSFPFEGTTLRDVVDSIRRQIVPSLRGFNSEIPEELEQLVRQGLMLKSERSEERRGGKECRCRA